jgi:hypothetical protein
LVEKQQKSLLSLYNNTILRKQVEEALNIGTNYQEIIDLCQQQGVSISKSAITRYKKKLKEAEEQGIPVGELIAGTLEWERKINSSIESKDKNKHIANIKNELESQDLSEDPEHSELTMDDSTEVAENADVDYKYLNDVEVLDVMIHKGLGTALEQDGMAPQNTIKAIELKNKLTDGALRGMTVKGINALQTRQQKLSYVLSKVLIDYVPKEKQEEARESLSKAEAEFNRNLDLDKDYLALKRALKAGGVDSDSL